jgi:integrase/recombinase XerD
VAAGGGCAHSPLAAGSAGRGLVAVRGLHRFALREGIVAANAAAAVRPPAPPRRLPKAVPVSVVEDIIAAAAFDDSPLAVRDQAMVELLYGTGARSPRP